MEKNKEETTFGAVARQTITVALVALVLVAAIHPLMILIGTRTDWFVYERLTFILGSAYGWLLGVGNFLGMAISLIIMTSSPAERVQAQKRAQAMYMGRLVILLLLAAGGCLIPVFHPAAILLSLAATQFGIFVYSLIFKLREANKQAKNEKNPPAQNADVGETNAAAAQEGENTSGAEQSDKQSEDTNGN